MRMCIVTSYTPILNHSNCYVYSLFLLIRSIVQINDDFNSDLLKLQSLQTQGSNKFERVPVRDRRTSLIGIAFLR